MLRSVETREYGRPGMMRWLIVVMALFVGFSGANVMAEEKKEEEPKPVTKVAGQITEEWFYDKEGLIKALGEAEANKEGVKSAEIWGEIVRTSPTGVVEKSPAKFTLEETKGVMGEVGAELADIGLFTTNNLWIMLAGCLVFLMHLGFASLESGLTRSKNTVNILFKNTMIICIGLLTYAIAGFALMYPGSWSIDGFLGYAGFGVTHNDAASNSPEYAAYTYHTDFFFQAMFAATAATIVSGAVAGRVKLSTFLIFSTLFVGICYPIVGSWKWGTGWLDGLGFYDFAGSTLVHSVGGWGALIMVILLGPRLGKYNKDGSANSIPGSSMPLAAVGVFLLWFGWFGFNGGSVLSADAAGVSLVLVTTSLAAAAGGLAAGLISWMHDGKPDLSMGLNGILAGLVGITAGADQMAVWEAVVIGLVAGVLVYFAVIAIDRTFKIDDPVGAISVHLVCGIWGTLAVGIFGAKASMAQLGYQAVGVLAYGVATIVFCLVVGLALKAAMGLRVSESEEIEGLDVGEHGMEAYPDFQTTVALQLER